MNMGQNYTFGNGPVDGAGLTELANNTITWETTEMANIGMDLSLLENRLEITPEYFIRNTKDILLRLPVPWIMGANSPFQNAGKVKNVGWDLGITFRNNINEFNYSVNAIVSDVKNEITDLKDAGPFIEGYTIRKEGHPIDALFGYQAVGLFMDQEEVDNHADQIGTVGPGDIKYKVQNTIDIG